MDNKDLKALLPDYVEGGLDASTAARVRAYLKEHPDIARQVEAQARAWRALGDWPDAQPDPGYVSRLWTRVGAGSNWRFQVREWIRSIVVDRRFLPVAAVVCVMLVIAGLTLKIAWMPNENGSEFVAVSQEDLEFLQDLELAENFEIIQDLDFLEDYDIILQLENHGS